MTRGEDLDDWPQCQTVSNINVDDPSAQFCVNMHDTVKGESITTPAYIVADIWSTDDKINIRHQGVKC